ncbi:MAG: hypothetical protein JSS83_28090 [Cyanobacteria bacterium SZAS LIN-3]|nr:hypothetical protein [Cyanobacteria bacterium SZAS LIN-3]MBS2011260.1 hypothetical protein [Cyanobacteria bacterium SZAS TMP-1]
MSDDSKNTQPVTPRFSPVLGPFPDVLHYVRERLEQPVTVPSPFALPEDTSVFQATVQKGRALLPERYHASYIDVLANSLALAEAQLEELKTSWRRKSKRQAVLDKLSEIFTVLAAPLVQLNSRSHANELKAYLALASNLYQRFFSDSKIARLNRSAVAFPQIDPLGFFTDNDSEPGIWSPSRELPLAIVSKPANQMNCLPLWVIDGHEVGGHGMYSHLSGFDTEMAGALTQAVEKTTGAAAFSPQLKVITSQLVSLVVPNRRKKEMAAAEFYAHIARSFSQELAADIAGVLNLGPMFVNGLIVYLANRRKDGQLSHTAPLVGRQKLNAYPPDLLRALVAIEALKHLDLKFGTQWQMVLRQRLLTACGGTLPPDFHFVAEQGIYKITVPTADLVALVPTLADALVNSKLPSLADRSLRQVLTWSDLDDQIVETLSRRLSKTDYNFEDLSDLEARHVSAAALSALEQVIASPQAKTLSARIHKNGLATLKSLYFEQCILCAVPTYGKTKRGNGDSQLCDLQDLLKMVRNFKGQK